MFLISNIHTAIFKEDGDIYTDTYTHTLQTLLHCRQVVWEKQPGEMTLNKETQKEEVEEGARDLTGGPFNEWSLLWTRPHYFYASEVLYNLKFFIHIHSA